MHSSGIHQNIPHGSSSHHHLLIDSRAQWTLGGQICFGFGWPMHASSFSKSNTFCKCLFCCNMNAILVVKNTGRGCRPTKTNGTTLDAAVLSAFSRMTWQIVAPKQQKQSQCWEVATLIVKQSRNGQLRMQQEDNSSNLLNGPLQIK